MDAFLLKVKASTKQEQSLPVPPIGVDVNRDDEVSTDVKLAILASVYPDLDQGTLLDFLIAAGGSLEHILESSASQIEKGNSRKRSASGVGHQTSLLAFRKDKSPESQSPVKRRTLTKKGQTLHLYTPEDIAQHTPCSIIHNFLPSPEADALLRELLDEAPTFERQTFKLFDNVVQSPHSACFYVESLEAARRQQTEYLYNGSYLTVRVPAPLLHFLFLLACNHLLSGFKILFMLSIWNHKCPAQIDAPFSHEQDYLQLRGLHTIVPLRFRCNDEKEISC